MAIYRQPAKDYARDKGITEEELREQILEGKLEGIEDDGVLFVRFEMEDNLRESSPVRSFLVGTLSSVLLFSFMGIWGPALIIVGVLIYKSFKRIASKEKVGRNKDATADAPKKKNEYREGSSEHQKESRHSGAFEETSTEDKGKTITCPSCQASIRIPAPIRNGRGRCRICSCRFKVNVDAEGVVYVQLIKGEEKGEEPQSELTIDRCFEILGIQRNASGDDIHAAYKKIIMGYHPDKVATLGPELKKLAEVKSKQINAAFGMLKRHGYVNE